MKKIIVGLVSLMITLLPCEVVFAFGHANSFGGSSSHSYGSSSHSNRYGGSTSHTAGQGTSHSNAYGGSSSHPYRGSPTPTTLSRRNTASAEWEGHTHTNTNGGSTTT